MHHLPLRYEIVAVVVAVVIVLLLAPLFVSIRPQIGSIAVVKMQYQCRNPTGEEGGEERTTTKDEEDEKSWACSDVIDSEFRT